MESLSFEKHQRVEGLLLQIENAIQQLTEWNLSVLSADDYYQSSEGMQKLAASCMMIEAIGEGINQIDKVTNGQFLPLYPDIPWVDIIGIRNHIAHGYFDIDGEIVFSVIKNDLVSLSKAIAFLKTQLTKEREV